MIHIFNIFHVPRHRKKKEVRFSWTNKYKIIRYKSRAKEKIPFDPLLKSKKPLLKLVRHFPSTRLTSKQESCQVRSRQSRVQDLGYHLAPVSRGNRGKGERFLAVERAAPIIDPPSVPIIWRNLINATLAFVVRAPGRATIITDSLIVSGQCVMTMHLVHAKPVCTIIGHANCRWWISACPPRYRPTLARFYSFTWETMYCWGIFLENSQMALIPRPVGNGD